MGGAGGTEGVFVELQMDVLVDGETSFLGKPSQLSAFLLEEV